MVLRKQTSAICKRQCQLDFEITMDAFLVPLPATTKRDSAPENKQFYFCILSTTTFVGMTEITTFNLRKSAPPPAGGSS